jgi:hypothetical protein
LVAAAIVLVAVVAALVIVVSAPSGATPPRAIESMFQDDDHLIYGSTPTVTRTLDTLAELGVARIRATVLWRAIAPDPRAATPPTGFDPADPADYAASSWAPYDRLVELAAARRIGVDFNVGAPGPLWAMGRPAPGKKYADHWMPSAAQFGEFVAAVARRYSGHYAPAGGPVIPRVAFWSIWNEPNQPGWLAPQWKTVSRERVIESAVLYRQYVGAAFAALARTGHALGTDTVLVGELAPEGDVTPTYTYADPVAPIPFLRMLYCVDATGRPLTGVAAAAAGCPGRKAGFVSAHPALFDATGFGHHPYSFFIAPSAQMSDTNFVPLSGLLRLEHALDAIFATYGVRRHLPLYLTEYGYETNPPNPYRGVSPSTQALYINEAEYMAWRDPRVRALSQFLLYDAPPDTRYPRGSARYWSTFQTGLRYADGVSKPALDAYRIPIFVPQAVMGGHTLVWGRIRPAAHDGVQRFEIEWAGADGSYRTIATATVSPPSDVLRRDVQVPGAGTIRIGWTSPSGRTYYSRAATVGGG